VEAVHEVEGQCQRHQHRQRQECRVNVHDFKRSAG
jgi:hypothetical protein